MKNISDTASIQNVALYIRVSSDEQAEKGDSIRDQRERGLKYIQEHNSMILQDIYIDDGVSGQKLERDDFSRLIENVKEGLVSLIIFTKLDRWFRSLRHYLNTQSILEKYNAAWIAIDQPYFDTSTPYGRAFVAQSMTWAELEAQNGGLRVSDVFRSKVEHGEVITGKVPRGYKIENKCLVLSEEAPAILDSILYFCRTQSLSSTITYLKETHGIVMTLQNYKMSLLRNEKLTGRYRGNETYCPRLISDAVFADVQRILDHNSTIRSNQKYDYLFSGLLHCGECGDKMCGCHIRVVSKRKSGSIYRYKYPAYECQRRRKRGLCANSGEIRELRIEEYLLSLVCEELNSYFVEYDIREPAPVNNRSKKERLHRKLERLKDLYINEAISLEEYQADRARYEAQLSALADIQETSRDLRPLNTSLRRDFETIYHTFDNLEKRAFWRAVLKEIRVTKSVNRHRDFTVIFL